MPLPGTTWFGVNLDAPDPLALAQFYQRLLGWQLFGDGPDDYSLAPSETAGYNLGIQRERDHVRPVWPAKPGDQQMQIHLDIEVDDVEQAVAYAIEAGAVQAEFQPQPNVRVMLDPAGHPFCLYRNEDD